MLSLIPVKAAEAPKPMYVKPLTVEETIVKAATMYAAKERYIDSIIDCESDYDQTVIGAEGEIGVAQFKPNTFQRMEKLMGEDLDINSYTDQIKLISWISVNKPELMREWTTWRALQNGGKYTFTSKKTGKTYTVICELK